MFEWLKNIFKKEDGFSTMSKPQKREYLSMDLIDRMIRVEQRVSASFGEYIPYTKTKYYQQLTMNEKKRYDSFLKNKKVKKGVFMTSFAGIFLFSLTLFSESTGNAISDYAGVGIDYLKVAAVVFYILLFVILLLIVLKRKRREESLNKVFSVFDKSMMKRKKKKN